MSPKTDETPQVPQNLEPVDENLLSHLPEGDGVVAWQSPNGLSRHGYNEKERRFEFNISGNAIFTIATHPNQTQMMSLDFERESPEGDAWICWGLVPISDTEKKCWGVLTGKINRDKKISIAITRLTLLGSTGSAIVRDKFNHITFPIDPIAGRTNVKVKADLEYVYQIWLNGKEILERPYQLPDPTDPNAVEYGAGFGGYGGSFFIHNFTIE